jgi:hypothetical protein
LAPTLALHLLQFVWSSIGTIIAVSICVCGTLLFCSREWRETLLGKPFNKLLDLYFWYHPTTYNFYFYVCDALAGTFNRWEVAIARRRMEDRPTLPNYIYQDLDAQTHIRLLRLKRKRIFCAPSRELIQVPLAPTHEEKGERIRSPSLSNKRLPLIYRLQPVHLHSYLTRFLRQSEQKKN